MGISYADLAFTVVPGSVTISLPDIRIKGQVQNDGQPGQPNTNIIDFTNGPDSDPDGKGTSLYKLISQKSGSQESMALVLAGLDSLQLAKAFAGIQ